MRQGTIFPPIQVCEHGNTSKACIDFATAITAPRRRGGWSQTEKLFRSAGFSAANTQLHQQRKHYMRQVVGQLIMFSQLLPEEF
jgi:hypothetical protein